jgi:hypothetical protein
MIALTEGFREDESEPSSRKVEMPFRTLRVERTC